MNKQGKIIIDELTIVNEKIDEKQINEFIRYIHQSSHIFLTGAGRSGLVIQSFANRLLHLGYSISVVGEISCPHTNQGDLLIISSGSGETKSLISQAQTAKENGLNIVLISTNNNSSLAHYANLIIVIPVQSKDTEGFTVQPMGTLFEQSSLILFDSIVLKLMKDKKETNKTMRQRHANIE
ncbi:6-phospho-3-hexuloisomerase [Floccifex sp.]|uniref:6-phospho-3-hexuloisomerase n=1 Tax=Floccifex sp. TaxID=2815810 RepID=UPI003F0FD2CC